MAPGQMAALSAQGRGHGPVSLVAARRIQRPLLAMVLVGDSYWSAGGGPVDRHGGVF